jgi:P4 family phage/plasmid primase-like protien
MTPINLRGGPLLERDYQALEARSINREWADRSFFRRVDQTEGCEILGRNGAGRYEGIAIPYIWPGEDRIREFRVRRDAPEYEKGKPKGKYMAPPGRGNLLYLPVGFDPAWLSDVTLELILVEGEFKCVAVMRAAWDGLSESAERPRFGAAAFGGVWNWWGTIGKVTNENNARVDEKGPISDLSRIAWRDRTVTIAFDRDINSNKNVKTARDLLVRELQSRGAVVKLFAWPKEHPEAKGIDDLLAAAGPALVLHLIGTAKKKAVPRSITGKEETNTAELADEITSTAHFAKDSGGRLYVYKDGFYQSSGGSFVSQRVKKIMTGWGLAAKWTSNKAEEVGEYIRVDCPELWSQPPADEINVENGLLDVNTRILRAHDPKFLSPIQLPVRYDPAARCPFWEKFVGEVFPEDSKQIAWEVPAWVMTPDTSIQKALLLLGEGANGKSVFFRACIAFLGKWNTVAISLHKLEQDKFAASRLVGKLANICPDLPTAHLLGTSAFKALTGGDVVGGEYKYHDSFDFIPFVKLIFSANLPPRSDDGTHGFFRRWIVVPFTRTFEEGAKDTLPRSVLDARLAEPSELSGVLNKALDALSRIRKNGFSEGKSSRDAWDEFRQATDPLTVWLDQHTIDDPEGVTPKYWVMAAYNKNCLDHSRPPMTKSAFGLALKRARKNLTDAERTVRGHIHWCYIGIKLKLEPPESQ